MLCAYSEETDDEYDTLITKEAYSAWREYIESRVLPGEAVTADSSAIVVHTPRPNSMLLTEWKKDVSPRSPSA